MTAAAASSPAESETASKFTAPGGKIICQIDGAEVHSIQLHLKENHPDWTIQRYKETYPDAPVLSELAIKTIERNEANKAMAVQNVVALPTAQARKGALNEVFDLGQAEAAFSKSTKKPIPVTVLPIDTSNPDTLPYVVGVDPDYVFNIDLVKKVIAGFEVNMPVYLWGFHGTGKTTILEQVCARTGRKFMRVQHTANTEESHVLGQWTVRSRLVDEQMLDTRTGEMVTVKKPISETVFQLGPLPLAMLHGMVYCADEYDFALPSVTSVYQSVLEGKPLVIKEAPAEFRVIRPHPEFRFCATGNTNGVGDETGLYQGTNIQNAANYSRFPIVEEVHYMDAKIETAILLQKSTIPQNFANKMVKFATEVRKAFADGKIGMTISPRELINACRLGILFGGDWTTGLQLAFANRLSRIDKKVVEEFAQRIFGDKE